jgi:5-oxopent-3-ene-1,2,5-tricarboxylate decarboxylase / 2-hydroxyhepta-2,4-diene-1,7-dioate isomerase
MGDRRVEMRRILLDGQAVWGRFEGDRIRLDDGRHVAADSAVHLPPCEPTKIVCVHLNYDARRIEFRFPNKEPNPTYFWKPTTTLNAHGGVLYRPQGCQFLNYEGEVAVVIGKTARNLSRDEAWGAIAGFAPVNDVGCHDFRDTDMNSMVRVKGMDGFCPIGPGLVSGIDIRESTVRTFINGKVVQEASVAEMEFGVDLLVADLSRHITLLPGDLILSGTPANSRPMQPGDVVEVEVSNVGRLRNTVAESPVPSLPVGHQPTATDAVRRVALGSDYFR